MPLLCGPPNDRSRGDRCYPCHPPACFHWTADYILNVPLSAWLWRFNEKQCGGGPLVFEWLPLILGGILFGGPVERVYAWIDKTPVSQAGGMVSIDAPAVIMFQYKAPRCYGTLDIEHTPKMRINSLYYADDDRIELLARKGIYSSTAILPKLLDLPELMLFKDGKTTPIPVAGVEWHDSFIAATQDCIEKLKIGRAAKAGWAHWESGATIQPGSARICQDW